jgi:hypothetical protein
MSVERLTVSIASELAIAVRKASEVDEQNVSAWLADAARSQTGPTALITSAPNDLRQLLQSPDASVRLVIHHGTP